jgi:hypothetical protein
VSEEDTLEASSRQAQDDEQLTVSLVLESESVPSSDSELWSLGSGVQFWPRSEPSSDAGEQGG